MPRPWLPLYCADYLAATRDLDPPEHGTYLLLLLHSWQHGPLPDDLDRLCRVAAGSRPQTVRYVLERYWVRGPEGWTNRRLEEERERAEEVSAKQRTKAERRWLTYATADAAAMPQHMPRHSHGSATADAAAHAAAHATALPGDMPQSMPQGMPPACPLTTHRSHKDLAPSVLVESQAFDPVDNSATPKLNGCPYQAIVDLYHELLVPPLPRVFQLTPARKQHMAARWRDELPDLADWRAYFGSVRQSKLVAGFRRPDGTYWKPNIDWLIKQGNLTKVAEGNYG